MVAIAKLGQKVHYALSEWDAKSIVEKRKKAGITGNPVEKGNVYPAEVTAIFQGCVNLVLTLDGPDTLWVTSRSEGHEDGKWHHTDVSNEG